MEWYRQPLSVAQLTVVSFTDLLCRTATYAEQKTYFIPVNCVEQWMQDEGEGDGRRYRVYEMAVSVSNVMTTTWVARGHIHQGIVESHLAGLVTDNPALMLRR